VRSALVQNITRKEAAEQVRLSRSIARLGLMPRTAGCMPHTYCRFCLQTVRALQNGGIVLSEIQSVVWTFRQYAERGEPVQNMTAQLKRESMNVIMRTVFSKRHPLPPSHTRTHAHT
jgi:hypothetical protein